jgi:hypothetical protein
VFGTEQRGGQHSTVRQTSTDSSFTNAVTSQRALSANRPSHGHRRRWSPPNPGRHHSERSGLPIALTCHVYGSTTSRPVAHWRPKRVGLAAPTQLTRHPVTAASLPPPAQRSVVCCIRSSCTTRESCTQVHHYRRHTHIPRLSLSERAHYG